MNKEIVLSEDEMRGYLLTMIDVQAGENIAEWSRERRIHATRITEFMKGARPTAALLLLMGIFPRRVYIGKTSRLDGKHPSNLQVGRKPEEK